MRTTLTFHSVQKLCEFLKYYEGNCEVTENCNGSFHVELVFG
jgi:hypothetical protein